MRYSIVVTFFLSGIYTLLFCEIFDIQQRLYSIPMAAVDQSQSVWTTRTLTHKHLQAHYLEQMTPARNKHTKFKRVDAPHSLLMR